jgi:hypothetical protein
MLFVALEWGGFREKVTGCRIAVNGNIADKEQDGPRSDRTRLTAFDNETK